MLDLLKNSSRVKVLTEEQQLSVSGGGTCGVVYHETSGGSFTCLMESGLSMADAKKAMHAFNNSETTTGNEYATWCCDSCSNYVPCN